MSKTKLALDIVQGLRSLADSLEALANAATDDIPTPIQMITGGAPGSPTPIQTAESRQQAVVPEKPLSLIDLRAFVAERSTPENRAKIKALLNKYGVAKLTELPEEHYDTFKREVAAL